MPKKQSSRTGSRQQRTSRKIPKAATVSTSNGYNQAGQASELQQSCQTRLTLPSSTLPPFLPAQPPAPSLKEVYGYTSRQCSDTTRSRRASNFKWARSMPDAFSFSSGPFLGRGDVVTAKPSPYSRESLPRWLPLRSYSGLNTLGLWDTRTELWEAPFHHRTGRSPAPASSERPLR